MIAAVNAMHEGDHVAGAVGEPQPQHLAVELDRLRDVAREQQHVREPARLHHGLACSSSARRATPGAEDRFSKRRLLVRRAFLGDANLDRRAVGIAKPDAVRLRAGRRVDARDAQLIEPRAEARQVILEGAERDELQLLARPLHHRAPAMRMTMRVQIERAVLFVHLQAERRIERLRRREIGHREIEAIERMHAELARPTANRLREMADLGHGGLSHPVVLPGTDHSVKRTAGKAPRHCRGRSYCAALARAGPLRRSAPPRR